MIKVFSRTAMLAAMLSGGSHAVAQTGDQAGGVDHTATASAQFVQFVPRNDAINTRIDYSIWDEALKFFVFRMGKSIREGAPSPSASMGSRRTYGHDSRYRLEGNRVTFSFLEPEIVQSLSDYRADLEQTASIVDIASLDRNEQLAYWINLHNAAVIEQIALAYPVKRPSDIRIAGSDLPLDETPFLTVAGVKLSPKDIRTRIVFPNWRDPKVMYGFFRGEIGGPSIQAEAYKGDNVGDLLDRSATEFVNSLRGTQKNGSKLDVSEIYAEARPYFFAGWSNDLKTHLKKYADADVDEIIDGAQEVRANIYEADIADLGKGGYDPSYSFVESTTEYGDSRPVGTRILGSIQRLLRERAQKVNKLIKRNELTGRVILVDIDLPGEDESEDEVE